MTESSIINIEEIRAFYEEICEEEGVLFSEEDFVNFVNHLEIDFFDWLRLNYKSLKNND